MIEYICQEKTTILDFLNGALKAPLVICWATPNGKEKIMAKQTKTTKATGSFWNKVDGFFEISKRGSNFKTEIIAGLTTFFAMAYIVITNPNQVVSFNHLLGG